MRADTEAYLRELRASLATGMAHAIDALRPYMEAHERGKVWSAVDRYDAVEQLEDLTNVACAVSGYLKDTPYRGVMKPVERRRLDKAQGGAVFACQTGRQVNIPAMQLRDGMETESVFQELMEPYKGAGGLIGAVMARRAAGGAERGGQIWFVGSYLRMMITLRRTLAQMFYLTNEAKLKIVRLKKDQSEALTDPGVSPEVRRAVSEAVRADAEKLAQQTGHFVEVEDHRGNWLFDASPHSATVRKELSLSARAYRKTAPYAANPPVKDYEVLADLYEWRMLE